MFTNHKCTKMVKQKQCCQVKQRHKCLNIHHLSGQFFNGYKDTLGFTSFDRKTFGRMTLFGVIDAFRLKAFRLIVSGSL
jgi:hypothetical protein